MPWRIKREVGMIFLGAIALALGMIALVLNRDAVSDLLAAGLVIGGLAIILNVTPTNGHNRDD